MATDLNKSVSRRTALRIQRRPIIVTVAPLGSQEDAMLGMRQQRSRVMYTGRVSDVYRVLALWHANKEKSARKAAKAAGIPWRVAKRKFIAENTIK